MITKFVLLSHNNMRFSTDNVVQPKVAEENRIFEHLKNKHENKCFSNKTAIIRINFEFYNYIQTEDYALVTL